MSKPIITHIESTDGEWEAIYLNGQKIDENHSISFPDFLRKIASTGLLNFVEVGVEGPDLGCENDEDYWDPATSFPDTLPEDLSTIPGYQG